MSLAILYSRAIRGIEAPQVVVEAHISNGLPSFSIVGLPETAVKESKDRVRSAILNANFEFPARRITINLAPADLPKEGGRFDLPIALGILAASGQIATDKFAEYEFAGELALTGELRSIPGILPIALACRKQNRSLIIPQDNAKEAALSSDIDIYPAQHMLDVCAYLLGKKSLPPLQPVSFTDNIIYLDLSDVKGQSLAKRALEIAAAGQHSLLMMGPPGTGKTMLATRLPGILPLLNYEEALEVAAIYSVARKNFDQKQFRVRPFRAPHHTASSVALVGGSSPPKPGEISLAHNGILFLDELPEFHRPVLEALREPLESGVVTISRASYQTQFPAHFQLVAAMNPCPCGFFGDPNGRCQCTAEQVQRYQAKISAPFLDRIDLCIEVLPLPKGILLEKNSKIETSEEIKKRVILARELQFKRSGKLNTSLTNKEIEKWCALDISLRQWLEDAVEKLNLSARAYHRILKVARTIADLENTEEIQQRHLAEALSYRQKKMKDF